MDDDYTARAAIRRPAPAGSRVAVHRRLAGVDDLYNARAAIRQPAPSGCWVVAHRRLAGVDDLYTALAAIRQPASAGCCVVVYGTQPSGGRPLAGSWAGTCAPLAVVEALLYSGHFLAAGSCRLLAVAPPLLQCLRLPAWLPSISTIFPTGEPITSPARAAHTHICGLDKTLPP